METKESRITYYDQVNFTYVNFYLFFRTFGPPTFFVTLNPAESYWEEAYEMYKIVHKIKADSLPKMADLIAMDPGLFSRHFEHRIRCIFKWLTGKNGPLGHVTHYFRRTEYQQRGTPHVHSLFWIKDAPKIGINTEEEVIQFINKYITCRIPDPVREKELYDKVIKFQKHKENCTGTHANTY